MATLVNKTVGTSGRDYATITLALAAVPANLVTADQQWTLSLYKDSDFDEHVVVPAITSDATRFLTITAPIGQRHTGKAGTGVRIKTTVTRGTWELVSLNSNFIVFEWIEIDCSAHYVNYGYHGIGSGSNDIVIRNNIIHDLVPNGSRDVGGIGVDNYYGHAHIQNNIIYKIGVSGISQVPTQTGIAIGNRTAARIWNNTVFDCFGFGIKIVDYQTGNSQCINNVSMGNTGGAGDFDIEPTAGKICNNNISSDATAGTYAGSGNLINKTTANQFVNTSTPPLDLRLKTGADAIGAGYNLGTDTLVNIDINGNDRAGFTWDIGSHEYSWKPPLQMKKCLTPFGTRTGTRQLFGV